MHKQSCALITHTNLFNFHFLSLAYLTRYWTGCSSPTELILNWLCLSVNKITQCRENSTCLKVHVRYILIIDDRNPP